MNLLPYKTATIITTKYKWMKEENIKQKNERFKEWRSYVKYIIKNGYNKKMIKDGIIKWGIMQNQNGNETRKN